MTSDPNRKPDFWFPAKTYGWGWGPPVAWQGWVVIGVFCALVALVGLVYPPPKHMAIFLGLVLLLTVLMSVICYWKGEKPKWRWGKDKGSLT